MGGKRKTSRGEENVFLLGWSHAFGKEREEKRGDARAPARDGGERAAFFEEEQGRTFSRRGAEVALEEEKGRGGEGLHQTGEGGQRFD